MDDDQKRFLKEVMYSFCVTIICLGVLYVVVSEKNSPRDVTPPLKPSGKIPKAVPVPEPVLVPEPVV